MLKFCSGGMLKKFDDELKVLYSERIVCMPVQVVAMGSLKVYPFIVCPPTKINKSKNKRKKKRARNAYKLTDSVRVNTIHQCLCIHVQTSTSLWDMHPLSHTKCLSFGIHGQHSQENVHLLHPSAGQGILLENLPLQK